MCQDSAAGSSTDKEHVQNRLETHRPLSLNSWTIHIWKDNDPLNLFGSDETVTMTDNDKFEANPEAL